MNATTRERNGPYSTWLAGLLLGFGLAWIAGAAAMTYGLTHPSPYDDELQPVEPLFLFDFLVLLMAAFSIGAAVRIRWRPRAWPMLTRVPKAALVSVVISGVLAGLIAYLEIFTYPGPNGTDWRVVVCGLVLVAAALSVVILMILRKRFFRAMQRT